MEIISFAFGVKKDTGQKDGQNQQVEDEHTSLRVCRKLLKHHALSPNQVDINDMKSSRTQMNRNYSTEGRRFRTVS
jgi:hypothetical protein